jgi:hypothetical protein
LTLTPAITTSRGAALPTSTLSLHFNPLYDQPSSLAGIAGVWLGPTDAVTTIGSGGALTVVDATGCRLSGTISLVESSYDIYSMMGTYSGCQGTASELNGLTAKGLLALNGEVSPHALYGGWSATPTTGDTAIGLANATVLSPPANLTYTTANTTLVVDENTGATLTPSVTGPVFSWSISPTLPPGMSFNPATGAISGTPTAISATTTYTVTAKNDAGSVSATLKLTVVEVEASVYQVGATGQVQAAVNAVSAFGIAQVSATIDGQSLGTLTSPNLCSIPPIPVCNGAYYAFTINALALKSGSHTLVVQVIDGKGVLDTVTQQLVFNNPPVVTVKPEDGAIVYGTLAVSGTVATDKGVAITTMATFNGVNVLAASGTSFSTTYDLTGLPAGNYPLVVIATDATGTTTTVDETITVASSAGLVYMPVATLGGGSQLLAVDPTTFAYATAAGGYYMQTGTQSVALQGISSSFEPNTWVVSNGKAYAVGNARDRPGTNTSIYEWNGSGAITNLSILENSPGVEDQLNAVHNGWVLWTANTGQLVFELYDPTSGSKFSIPAPTGTSTVIQGDFYLGSSGLVLYFAAQAANTPIATANIYQWNQISGTSSLIYSGGPGNSSAPGLNTQVQTDGTRVAWETSAPGAVCFSSMPCALTVLDIASNTTQQLSQTLQSSDFFLGDGVLAWYESSSSLVGGVRDSPHTGAPVQTPSAAVAAQLYGTGGGYVLYLDADRKLYAWNTSSNSAQLLFDAAPGTAKIAGKTVYFTNGNAEALYQVTLP